MTNAGNGRHRFRVLCSGAMTARIRLVHRRARRRGQGEVVTRAFRQIIRRLQIDAFRMGEPAYRLPSLRMQIRTVIVRPLVVDFGVCEDRPIVFIKSIRLLSAQS